MQRGKLIVIDGADGAGKTTQFDLLVKRLRRKRIRVETLNFPQYEQNFFGTFLKECLAGKYGDFIAMNPYLVSIAYAADRWESKALIEKWLSEGALVLLDRYTSANQIHQGGKIENDSERSVFLDWLDKLEHGVFGLPRPDLILFLHVPVAISLKLIAKRRRKKDLAEKNALHLEKTRLAALKIIASKGTWRKIECATATRILPVKTIHERIYKVVSEFLGV